jgi:hypothetical protein
VSNPKTNPTQESLKVDTFLAFTRFCRFGEGGGSTEEDVVSNFFITLGSFIKSFNASVADNQKIKDDLDKAVKKQQEAAKLKENRAARAASVMMSALESGTASNEGIFADFKKSQARQADDIIHKRRSDRQHAAGSRAGERLV